MGRLAIYYNSYEGSGFLPYRYYNPSGALRFTTKGYGI